MTPATWPRAEPLDERLLHVDALAGTVRHARVRDLANLLRPGDLLVVNDAATLPASLPARGPEGEPMEVRLAGEGDAGEWWAVLFGAGDWRARTEDRPPPPLLAAGVVFAVGGFLKARVQAVSEVSPRLVRLRFDREGDALWSALYRIGSAVQYSYVAGPLPLEQAQTAYGGRPWSVELPSAGRPLRLGLLLELQRRGVRLARLTHAAGLSATGDAVLDAHLPLPERYELPAATAEAVVQTRAAGGRVVAVGTTVVRALEDSAARHGGRPVPGTSVAHLRVDASFRPRAVDGLVTGLHEPGSSHYRLLTAFASEDLLGEAWRQAEDAGYLAHEFGDSALILRG